MNTILMNKDNLKQISAEFELQKEQVDFTEISMEDYKSLDYELYPKYKPYFPLDENGFSTSEDSAVSYLNWFSGLK
jgi:hypothetical protein